MDNAKEEFKYRFKEHIQREGSAALLLYLENDTDFFTAPASTRFHSSYPQGLVHHSLLVYEQLSKNQEVDLSDESIAIIGLLHDVCKANFYTVQMRNNKNEETGKWEKVPFYTVNDQFPYGHGEKSVYLIERYMRLTDSEAMAIRYHMGAYEGPHIYQSLAKAYQKYPIVLFTHYADLYATYIIENKEESYE